LISLLLACLSCISVRNKRQQQQKGTAGTQAAQIRQSLHAHKAYGQVNGNFSLSQITYEMEQAMQKGMGGFDIWDVGTTIDVNKLVRTVRRF
jgi:hypothetical protein